MPVCNACRRPVDNPVVGKVGGGLTVNLCGDCEAEIVGGKAYKRLRFPANKDDTSGGE